MAFRYQFGWSFSVHPKSGELSILYQQTMGMNQINIVARPMNDTMTFKFVNGF
jgi:hypothetical protein